MFNHVFHSLLCTPGAPGYIRFHCVTCLNRIPSYSALFSRLPFSPCLPPSSPVFLVSLKFFFPHIPLLSPLFLSSLHFHGFFTMNLCSRPISSFPHSHIPLIFPIGPQVLHIFLHFLMSLPTCVLILLSLFPLCPYSSVHPHEPSSLSFKHIPLHSSAFPMFHLAYSVMLYSSLRQK